MQTLKGVPQLLLVSVPDDAYDFQLFYHLETKDMNDHSKDGWFVSYRFKRTGIVFEDFARKDINLGIDTDERITIIGRISEIMENEELLIKATQYHNYELTENDAWINAMKFSFESRLKANGITDYSLLVLKID